MTGVTLSNRGNSEYEELDNLVSISVQSFSGHQCCIQLALFLSQESRIRWEGSTDLQDVSWNLSWCGRDDLPPSFESYSTPNGRLKEDTRGLAFPRIIFGILQSQYQLKRKLKERLVQYKEDVRLGEIVSLQAEKAERKKKGKYVSLMVLPSEYTVDPAMHSSTILLETPLCFFFSFCQLLPYACHWDW